MSFRNREQAAALLATRLAAYRGQAPLVLAIPRGAAPMARIIADALDGEMDVVLVHKLRMPGQPELAIGSVDETGQVYVGEYARGFGVSDEDLAQEKRVQLDTLRKRRALYSPVHPPIDPAGRIVIVVDDGIATGSTVLAALRGLSLLGATRRAVATPLAAREAIERLRSETEWIAAGEIPVRFGAVGAHYACFEPVSDEELLRALAPAAPGGQGQEP